MHNHEGSSIQVAIIGNTGYSGLELARLLKRHPYVQVKAVFNSQDVMTINPSEYQVIFLATPAEVSMELAPKFIAQGVHVIDLSGAFRLNTDDIKHSYNARACSYFSLWTLTMDEAKSTESYTDR